MLVGVACAVAHGAITGNWVGCLMNIIACCAFVIPASIIYKRNRTFKGAMIGLVVSIVCLVVAAIIANLAIDPTFYGIPFDVVAGLIVPAILPFNIIKGVVISVLDRHRVQEHLEPNNANERPGERPLTPMSWALESVGKDGTIHADHRVRTRTLQLRRKTQCT